MVKIAPSILSADFAILAEEGAKGEQEAGVLHLDVMDGHFVPNFTFGPPLVAALRKRTALPLDVHLMISDPDRHLVAFAEAGADYLTVHVEACPHLHRTVQRIQELAQMARRNALSFELEVDGGIKVENCREVSEAGATILVAGSAVFGSTNPAEAIRQMNKRLLWRARSL